MLLQTTSYIVPKEKRAEHARLLRRFRQTLHRLGCDHFEVFEQVGANWNTAEANGRFVQILRFRDRRHHQAVQTAERNDPTIQKLIAEFCHLVNLPYQQQQGLFATGFYTSFMKLPSQQAADSAAAAKHEPADLSAPAENSEADAPVDDAWSMIAEKSSEAAENPVHPQKHAL